MKKLLIILICLSVLLFSCGEGGSESGFTEMSAYGLSYRLPTYMYSKNVPYGDVNYTDGDAWFFFNAFGEVEMAEDLMINVDTTVLEYTEDFLIFNPYTDDFDYDEERNAATFEYVYDYEDGETPKEYYRYLITRSEDCLYVVVLSCNESSIDKYKADFDAVMNSIRLDPSFKPQ